MIRQSDGLHSHGFGDFAIILHFSKAVHRRHFGMEVKLDALFFFAIRPKFPRRELFDIIHAQISFAGKFVKAHLAFEQHAHVVFQIQEVVSAQCRIVFQSGAIDGSFAISHPESGPNFRPSDRFCVQIEDFADNGDILRPQGKRLFDAIKLHIIAFEAIFFPFLGGEVFFLNPAGFFPSREFFFVQHFFYDCLIRIADVFEQFVQVFGGVFQGIRIIAVLISDGQNVVFGFGFDIKKSKALANQPIGEEFLYPFLIYRAIFQA